MEPKEFCAIVNRAGRTTEALNARVEDAFRQLTEQCAHYIAENLPQDNYQSLRIHREVRLDQLTNRTIVVVRLDIADANRQPGTNILFYQTDIQGLPLAPLSPTIAEALREQPQREIPYNLRALFGRAYSSQKTGIAATKEPEHAPTRRQICITDGATSH